MGTQCGRLMHWLHRMSHSLWRVWAFNARGHDSIQQSLKLIRMFIDCLSVGMLLDWILLAKIGACPLFTALIEPLFMSRWASVSGLLPGFSSG